MSPKRWLLLLLFYICYLLFGASIYYQIEHSLEKQSRAAALKERIEFNDFLMAQIVGKNLTMQQLILERITAYCGKPVTQYAENEADTPYIWTFYHAFFFAFTVCSTVGYGNISPTTTLGRMIMIVYSVIGIPINGILFAGLGEYFGRTFEAIYRRYKKYKMSTNIHYVPPKLGLITTVVIALVPGIALFLLLPSLIFSHFEDWPYTVSLYYSYVTTTTIGFGDYVPTFNTNQARKFGALFVIYEVFVIVWFIFSLGYVLMIMTLITHGLQSKKLALLEKQLSSNIKATHQRIWHGVTKDVGYLRRLLNELYILKVKPVYNEPDFACALYRSNSCPEITMYRGEPLILPARKRAYSESHDLVAMRSEGTPPSLAFTASDTELSKYDRTKIFERAEAYRQTTDLLAKVVTALSNIKAPIQEVPDNYGYACYNGFSDSQILASEWSYPSVNDASINQQAPMQRRARACSDFNIVSQWPAAVMPTALLHNEWTWSGDNNQIQKAINKRYQQAAHDTPPPPPLDDSDSLKKSGAARAKKFSVPDGFRRLFPFKKRFSQEVSSRKQSVDSSAVEQPQPVMEHYSTVTANASAAYLEHLNKRNSNAYYPSSISLNLNPVAEQHTNLGYVDETAQRTDAESGAAAAATTNALQYQRKTATTTTTATTATTATKKRRESLYTQNPVVSGVRRGSMFTQIQNRNNAAATGATATTTAAATAGATRRGSLFPAIAQSRRSSNYSLTSEKDMNVLEQTTLADLIRVLEIVHTQAILDEQEQAAAATEDVNADSSSRGGRSRGRGRLSSRHAVDDDDDSSQLPQLFSILGGDQKRLLTATAANRFFARRSTIVGTMPTTTTAMATATTTLSRAKQNAAAAAHSHPKEPPPSYSETPPTPPLAASVTEPGRNFRRRFSVRPTALQIPPGKAPPPPPPPPAWLGSDALALSNPAAQRRSSMRPSPLARELSSISDVVSDAGSVTGTAALDTQPVKYSPRLMSLMSSPAGINWRSSTSGTHSPLSRIAQITQAQRKSNTPDNPSDNATMKTLNNDEE